eukprot:1882725-Amphidinium_carterae.1
MALRTGAAVNLALGATLGGWWAVSDHAATDPSSVLGSTVEEDLRIGTCHPASRRVPPAPIEASFSAR